MGNHFYSALNKLILELIKYNCYVDGCELQKYFCLVIN